MRGLLLCFISVGIFALATGQCRKCQGPNDTDCSRGGGLAKLRGLFEMEDPKDFIEEVKSMNRKEFEETLADVGRNWETRPVQSYAGMEEFTIISNGTGVYSNIGKNDGSYNMTIYHKLDSQGTAGTYTSISIAPLEGNATEHGKHFGVNVVFSRTYYTKLEKFIDWQTFTSAVFLAKYNGAYYDFGSHFGAAQGMLFPLGEGREIGVMLQSFGITKMGEFSTRTVTKLSGMMEDGVGRCNLEMYSTNGGPNVTMSSFEYYDEGVINAVVEQNGTLKLRDRDVQMINRFEISGDFDMEDDFNDKNLGFYFGYSEFGIGIALP